MSPRHVLWIALAVCTLTVPATARETNPPLQKSGGNVVIVSDPAGGQRQWSATEVAALATYAQAGRDLVGTFLLLLPEYQDGSAFEATPGSTMPSCVRAG